MTVREALSEGAAALEHHETDTPRLDAALLLAHARGSTRERLYMDLAESAPPAVLDSYRNALHRRLSGEPVAWIIGVKEFWGLEFTVGPGVLCPRPDSEILVEAALEIMQGMIPEAAAETAQSAIDNRPLSAKDSWRIGTMPHNGAQSAAIRHNAPRCDDQPPIPANHPTSGRESPLSQPGASQPAGVPPSAVQHRPAGRLHDCCCGPGTLALALSHRRPDWDISASDISEDAARYFALNNEKLCAGRVGYSHADLMEGIGGPFDIIVSNPPYLTPAETEERTALGWREPVLALNGKDTDGLGIIRRLIPRIFNRLSPGGTTLIEADPLQMPRIEEILFANGFEDIEIRRDLGNRDRVMIARRHKIK